MIKVKSLEQGFMQVKSTQRLVHPKTNMITIQIGQDAQCNFPMTVEFAFSNGYDFLTDILPDFSQYAVLLDDKESMTYYNMRSKDHPGLVMTYQNVPLTALAKFLNMYAEK
jgi:hypothetical protein